MTPVQRQRKLEPRLFQHGPVPRCNIAGAFSCQKRRCALVTLTLYIGWHIHKSVTVYECSATAARMSRTLRFIV
jgi:hypothetical protein